MTRQRPGRAIARTHHFYSRWCAFHRHPCMPLGPVTFAWPIYGIDWAADNEPRFGLVLL